MTWFFRSAGVCLLPSDFCLVLFCAESYPQRRNVQMSNDPHTKGPHDIGGEAAGPIDTTDHGMLFWERQANALRSTLSRSGLITVDELRRAAESLGDEYKKLAYFEVTTSALRTVLLEKGYFTERELEAKMAEIRRRFDVPDEMQSPVKQKGGR
jgi:hypothetical protein